MNEEATAQVTTCPQCEKAVDADSKFCKYCACELTPADQPSKTNEVAQRFCPHCEGTVGARAEFCGSCGESLPKDSQVSSVDEKVTSDEATTPPRITGVTGNQKTAILVVAGLAVVGVIGLIVVVILIAALSSQSKGPLSSNPLTTSTNLTTEKAQRTLSGWVSKGGVTVIGVQEVPAENAAVAQLSFTNFAYKLRDPMFGGQNDKTYSGPGNAIFTHYTDGRWVLTKVTIGQGFDSVWWDNLNVEAR